MPATTASRTLLLALALGLLGTPAVAGASTLVLSSAPVAAATEEPPAPVRAFIGPVAPSAPAPAPVVEPAPDAPAVVTAPAPPVAAAPASAPEAEAVEPAPVVASAAVGTSAYSASAPVARSTVLVGAAPAPSMLVVRAGLVRGAPCETASDRSCGPAGKRRWLARPPVAPAPAAPPVTAPRTAPVSTTAPAPVAPRTATVPVASPTTASTATPATVPSASPTAPPVVATTAPTAAPVPAPAASTPTRPVAQWGAVAFRGESAELTNVDKYAYVQLNAWETDRAAALKAEHPGLKVLVYKDMSSTRSYAVTAGKDDVKLPTGVGYAEAEAKDSSWFLTDTTGARMVWPYDGHWWMDVAHPGYQRAWVANVRAELAAGPWDGVVIDNVMASPEWYLGDRTIAKYPTRAAYEAATESFLRTVGPALKADGGLVIGNISDAYPATWDRWTALLSGGNHEHSFSWNNGVLYGGNDWLGRVEEIERTQRAGRVHTASSEAASTDVRALTYLRASWLMAWDGGRTGSAQMVAIKDARDPWNAVVGTDLGLPAGARTAVGGAWKRDFTAGTAVVNPSTGSVTVPLGRTMTDSRGARVSSVVLAPLTAALLRP